LVHQKEIFSTGTKQIFLFSWTPEGKFSQLGQCEIFIIIFYFIICKICYKAKLFKTNKLIYTCKPQKTTQKALIKLQTKTRAHKHYANLLAWEKNEKSWLEINVIQSLCYYALNSKTGINNCPQRQKAKTVHLIGSFGSTKKMWHKEGR
jgi:hypothetical protein